jgi:hypothetical protein
LEIGSVPEVQINQGDYFDYETPKTICVDACIELVIKTLWENGIETLGCCCGHNEEMPSVILSNKEDTRKAFQLIAGVDRREFHLLSWQLVGYTRDISPYQDAASKVLRDKTKSKAAKTAAGEALSQPARGI